MDVNIRRLTLEQMRVFVSIVECGNFTKAAGSHMRTQTAVTRQIKTMEDILGVQLFRRTRGRVEGVTDAGRRLLPYTQKVLATVDDAWASINRYSFTGYLRVGVMDDIDVPWLNHLLNRFKATCPECDVRIISDFSARLERRLEAHEIDVAIVKRLGLGDLCKNTLRRERLLWAAGPCFHWNSSIPLPLIVFHEGCVYRRHIIQKLALIGVSSRIVYDGQSYMSVKAAVSAGLGISAFGESHIRDSDLVPLSHLGGVVLPDLGYMDIMVHYVKEPITSLLKAFMQEVKFLMLNTACMEEVVHRDTHDT